MLGREGYEVSRRAVTERLAPALTALFDSRRVRGSDGRHDRNDLGYHVLLHDHEERKQNCEHNAVHKGARQHRAFAAAKIRDGNAGCDVLRGDHLPHDSAGGVGRGEQHGT